MNQVEPHKKASILSFKGFRHLWIGQLISQFGDVLYVLVFLWLVLEATGDKAAVGIVGAAGAMPYLLFSLYAGTVADKYDRRKILILSDIVSAVFIFGFSFLVYIDNAPPLFVICSFAFFLGCANVFATPAKSAATPRLVPPDRLIEANSLHSATQSGMPLIGNAVSALILHVLFKVSASFAYVITFVFNGITFLLSAFFMSLLPSLKPERDESPQTAWHDAIAGVKFILHDKVLLPAIIAIVGMNFFIAPFMPAYVVVAQQRFEGTPSLLALLETGFFLGMLVGSLFVMKTKIKRAGIAFSLFLVISAITIIPMGFVYSTFVFWLLNFFCGIFIPFASIPINTLIQVVTPDAFRGRVNSCLSMMSAAAMPLGMGLSGFLMDLMGIEGIFIYMGVGFAVSAMFPLIYRTFRHAILPETATEQGLPVESQPLEEAAAPTLH